MRYKAPGRPRNKDLENLVVHLRANKKLEFSRIGDMLGFSRQRAHKIYSRYIKEVEDGNDDA